MIARYAGGESGARRAARAGSVVVVVDAFRASTTIAVLVSKGASVVPVASVEEAASARTDFRIGERGSSKVRSRLNDRLPASCTMPSVGPGRAVVTAATRVESRGGADGAQQECGIGLLERHRDAQGMLGIDQVIVALPKFVARRVVAPLRGESRANHHGSPRPHRVQLPHVAEVTEAREPHAAIAEDFRDLARIEVPPEALGRLCQPEVQRALGRGYNKAKKELIESEEFLAEIKTKTGTVGFVGGCDVPLIKKFEAGFIAGAVNGTTNEITLAFSGAVPISVTPSIERRWPRSTRCAGTPSGAPPEPAAPGTTSTTTKALAGIAATGKCIAPVRS